MGKSDEVYRPKPYSQMKDSSDMNMMEKMKMMMMMKKMTGGTKNNYYADETGSYKRNDDMGYQNKMDSMDSMFRSMGQMRFKRQAGDSLALNDRQNNNIDVNAMKRDAEQYKMPSTWFGDRYEEILESCHQVAENLPASLQDKVLPNNYNGPMRNLAKIKSFMNCCKTAKMKLCMYQDTKKKIETNFGPVDQLLEGFNNQITEEQVFYMVNELLQGDDDQFM